MSKCIRAGLTVRGAAGPNGSLSLSGKALQCALCPGLARGFARDLAEWFAGNLYQFIQHPTRAYSLVDKSKIEFYPLPLPAI